MLIYDKNAVATYDLKQKDPVLFNIDIEHIKSLNAIIAENVILSLIRPV